MKKTSFLAELIISHPVPIILTTLLIYWFWYISGVVPEHALFGDMIGKWMQVQDFLNKPWGDFSCFYREQFDSGFEFLPGPAYYYSITKSGCLYYYPYPFAMAVAPFVRLSPLYGFFIFNLIFWVLYTLSLIQLSRNVFPDRPTARVWGGLASFLILPTGVYAFDFSAMSIAIALACVTIALASGTLNNDRRPGFYFLAGFSGGLIFAFRSEGVFFIAFVTGAFFIDRFIAQTPPTFDTFFRRIKVAFRETLPLILGTIFALLIVFLYHYLLFGNILGIRGASATGLLQNFKWSLQMGIAYRLLFGGSIGLFSSLPLFLVGSLVFLPTIFRRARRRIIFFILIAVGTTIISIFTAPFDGGYSWSPRYLAFTLPAYLMLVFLVIFSDHPLIRKRSTRIILFLIITYSLYFVHRGMKIVQQAGKQNQAYDQIISLMLPPSGIIVINNPQIYGIFSRWRLNGKIYQVTDMERYDRLRNILLTHKTEEILFLGLQPVDGHSISPLPESSQSRIIERRTKTGIIFLRIHL